MCACSQYPPTTPAYGHPTDDGRDEEREREIKRGTKRDLGNERERGKEKEGLEREITWRRTLEMWRGSSIALISIKRATDTSAKWRRNRPAHPSTSEKISKNVFQ